jgi:aminopeptidase
MDERWRQLAAILVNYSARVGPGDRVMIAMKETTTLPLARAVHEAAVKAGALVQVQFQSDYLWHAEMRYGSPGQVTWVPEIEAYGMEWADVYFGLRGAHNPHQFADINAETLAAHRRAMGQISTRRWQKTRWCLVRVPNAALAQQAQTDLDALLDMFFKACLRDWAAETRRWESIAEHLNRGSQVRLVGQETDLSFSVQGRSWAVGSGRENMPDGEIMTAPVNSSLNGQIYFDFPGVLGGRLMHDIRLEWRDGELVGASASRNQDFLEHVLSLDAGARRLGEFAIGTNDAIDRFCGDILLDEKMGGTVHVALGRAYPQVGGTNQSALHWDIIKDTRQAGIITLDGEPVWEKGRFLIGPKSGDFGRRFD